MTKYNEIHKHAAALKDAIAAVVGHSNVLVAWSVTNSSADNSVSGLSLGDDVTADDCEKMCFRIVGRAYNNISYGGNGGNTGESI